MTSELRDLIYFDLAKATSLFSQAEGGLLEKLQETYESGHIKKGSAGLNIPVIKADFGGDFNQKTSILESRIVHHDLLTKLENWLKQNELLVDINILQQNTDYSDESLRSLVTNPSFIVVEGWSEFWTYDRFKFFLSKYGDLSRFDQMGRLHNFKQSDLYKQAEQEIEQLRTRSGEEKNPSIKSSIKQQIRQREAELDQAIKSFDIPNPIQDWQIEGINTIIDTFMSKRLDLRIYPFEQNPNFNFVCNLKHDCFLDADLENILFSYGTRPNVLLTVFGLITSLPPADKTTFDPTDTLTRIAAQRGETLEVAFRQTGRILEGLDQLSRFSRYPNVTVYPIAVYQKLGIVEQNIDTPNE